jgi:hypothetical protein
MGVWMCTVIPHLPRGYPEPTPSVSKLTCSLYQGDASETFA